MTEYKSEQALKEFNEYQDRNLFCFHLCSHSYSGESDLQKVCILGRQARCWYIAIMIQKLLKSVTNLGLLI